MIKTCRLLHLTVREGLSSIYPAQVARPMSVLLEEGYDASLVVFCPVGEFVRPRLRQQWQRREQVVVDEFGLSLQRFVLPPSRMKCLWSGVSLLRLRLRYEKRSHRDILLHCRGPMATELAVGAAARMPRVRVLFDCRGMNGVEYAYDRGYLAIDQAPSEIRVAAERIEGVEQRAAREAGQIICVSDAMRRVIKERWRVPEGKIAVVPCCTNVAAGIRGSGYRVRLRRELGLDERFVVLFSGSMATWQMPKESLILFEKMLALRPNAHFLGLTTQPVKLAEFVRDSGIPQSRTTILSISHTDMPRYLAVADCGLLVRERCLVNEVASPVKFAEYLSAGVPVVLSEGIGDYSDLVRREGIGAVLGALPSQCGTAAVQSVLAEIGAVKRTRCQEVAERDLDWGRFLTIMDGLRS